MIQCIRVLLLLSFLNPNYLWAQEIQWQNVIGGNETDQLYSIQPTSDGGYICGGRSDSNISGDKSENCQGNFDYWVVKLDPGGNIQWQNTIGGSGLEWLTTIQQTSDGGYILGGKSDSDISGDKTENSHGNTDFWVVKLDSIGSIQWQNTIGGDLSEHLSSLDQTSDGGYILGGWSISGISGNKTEASQGAYDYWVVRLDGNGAIVWQNTIGGSHADYLYSMQQTSDGGYICGGSSLSSISGDKTEDNRGFAFDYWIIKLDIAGNIQWQKTLGGGDSDELLSLQQTSDGGYICGGISTSNISGEKTENCSGTADYWVIKLDSFGNIIWQNTIGGSGYEVLYSIAQSSDGGYICCGSSNSDTSGDKSEDNKGGLDYWVVKLDQNGNVTDQNTIGGNSDDYGQSIEQNPDGSYILGGWSHSYLSGDKTENNSGNNSKSDYWILKLCASSYSTVIISACGQYVSPGGNIFTASGIYTDTIAGSFSCDSIVTINLTILPVPVVSITSTGATTFCQGDSVLLSATTGFSSYQWYSRNYAIPGATTASYYAKSTGRYRCVAQNTVLCSDTSNIILVNVPCIPIGPNHDKNGVYDVSENTFIQIYPNPGNGVFVLKSPPGKFEIISPLGEVIYSDEINNEEKIVDISAFADGIYFVQSIQDNRVIQRNKVILFR